jgi:hypothetical protein
MGVLSTGPHLPVVTTVTCSREHVDQLRECYNVLVGRVGLVDLLLLLVIAIT